MRRQKKYEYRIYDRLKKEFRYFTLNELCEKAIYEKAEKMEDNILVVDVIKDCFGRQINYSINRCTNIKDSNGNIIYEGDILNHLVFRCLGELRHGTYIEPEDDCEYVGFYIDWDDSMVSKSLGSAHIRVLVIGNIYEELERIKKEDAERENDDAEKRTN